MKRSIAIAASAVIALVLIAITILAGGGDETARVVNDVTGDVRVERGPKAPGDLARADIGRALITSGEDGIELEVEMATSIPSKLATESLEWRWEIYEDDALTWIVVGNVNEGPSASLVATQSDYSASTLDGSFPGRITVNDRTVLIRLDADGIDGFPSAFEWFVTTSLDGDRLATGSAEAADRAPRRGRARLGG